MKGQTLIETLVALGIAVIVISAITTTAISSLSNSQYIRNQDMATKYATEGIEIVRKIRNAGYTNFRTYNGTYCLAQNQTTLGSAVASCTTLNIGTTFIRSVQVQLNGCSPNISRATVIVAYTSGKCTVGTYCHSSRLISCLSTVDPVPAP